jgi:hypothetical protein
VPRGTIIPPVNDAISAAKRPSLWALLRDYSVAVAQYWYAIVVGIVLSWVDFAERSLGTWWVFRPWVRLVTVTLAFTIAQFLAYRKLHLAHVTELMALRDEEERESQRSNAEREALQRQIEALKVRPYDQAQIELVRGKLRGLDKITLNVVKFLLQNGPTGRDSMDSQLSCPQQVLDGAVSNLRHRLLIFPEDKPNIGRSSTTTFWSINPKF